MGANYKTIEALETYYFPAWTNTWPNYDGCNAIQQLQQAVGYTTPVSSDAAYEPIVTAEFRTPSKHRSRRPGFPPYTMTPYSVSKVTTYNYLTRRTNASTVGTNRWDQYGFTSKIGSVCKATVTSAVSSGPVAARWNEVSHTCSYTVYNPLYQFYDQDMIDAKTAVENEASLAALTSYDVLTDAAEFREVPELVRSISGTLIGILKTLRGHYDASTLRYAARIPIKQLLKHPYRTLRKLGDEWMQYRYGIMPLVYSFNDILKNSKRHMVHTEKKTRVVTPRKMNVTLPQSSSNYVWQQYTGTVRYTATVYQVYSSEEASLYAGLGFNPLVTAWELIPYSFVIDWFVNVGDYIARKTGAILSEICWACVSRREQSAYEKWVHFADNSRMLSFNNDLPTNWQGTQPPGNPQEKINRPEESQLLQKIETNSYDRWLFSVRDAHLSVKPSLNWRRLIDGAVMAVSQLNTLNKRLR